MMRRGEISFEHVVYASFVVIVIATIAVSIKFYNSKQISRQTNKNVTVSYASVMDSIRQDARLGTKYIMTSDGFSITKSDGSIIAIYKFENNALYRIQGENSKIIADNLEKASFSIHHELKNLLIVLLLPKDKMLMPFFTSFALRGSCHAQ